MAVRLLLFLCLGGGSRGGLAAVRLCLGHGLAEAVERHSPAKAFVEIVDNLVAQHERLIFENVVHVEVWKGG